MDQVSTAVVNRWVGDLPKRALPPLPMSLTLSTKFGRDAVLGADKESTFALPSTWNQPVSAIVNKQPCEGPVFQTLRQADLKKGEVVAMLRKGAEIGQDTKEIEIIRNANRILKNDDIPSCEFYLGRPLTPEEIQRGAISFSNIREYKLHEALKKREELANVEKENRMKTSLAEFDKGKPLPTGILSTESQANYQYHSNPTVNVTNDNSLANVNPITNDNTKYKLYSDKNIGYIPLKKILEKPVEWKSFEDINSYDIYKTASRLERELNQTMENYIFYLNMPKSAPNRKENLEYYGNHLLEKEKEIKDVERRAFILNQSNPSVTGLNKKSTKKPDNIATPKQTNQTPLLSTQQNTELNQNNILDQYSGINSLTRDIVNGFTPNPSYNAHKTLESRKAINKAKELIGNDPKYASILQEIENEVQESEKTHQKLGLTAPAAGIRRLLQKWKKPRGRPSKKRPY